MNSWLLVSVIILIVAVVILIGCIVAVLVPIKNIITVLLAHVKGIEKQLNGIQTQMTILAATIDKMNTDVQYKKESVLSVVQSVRDTGQLLNQISDSSHEITSAIVKKANSDPQRQAQVEEWTNTAMRFLNRKAQ